MTLSKTSGLLQVILTSFGDLRGVLRLLGVRHFRAYDDPIIARCMAPIGEQSRVSAPTTTIIFILSRKSQWRTENEHGVRVT